MKINAQKMLELEPLATAPTSPVEGQLYYNSTSKKVQTYNGTSWEDMGGGGIQLKQFRYYQSTFSRYSEWTFGADQEMFMDFSTTTMNINGAGSSGTSNQGYSLNWSGDITGQPGGKIYLGYAVADVLTQTYNNTVTNGSLAFTFDDWVKDIERYDHITAESDLTIKMGTTGGTGDPESTFDSFGTEFNGTEYDNTSDYSDANYVQYVGNTARDVWCKFENVTSKEFLMPTLATQLRSWSSGGSSRNFGEPYIWNFTLSQWDRVWVWHTVYSSGQKTTGQYQYAPVTKFLDPTDYVSGGVSYLRIYIAWGGGSGAECNLGYIGLWTSNNQL